MGAIDTLSVDGQLEAIYVGYFGRGADGKGFAFWEGQYTAAIVAGQTPDQALNNIANSFAMQPETLALFPFLSSGSVLGTTSSTVLRALATLFDDVYLNLFNRNPGTSDKGVQYWVGQLVAGNVGLGT